MPQTSPELRLASGNPDHMVVFDPDLSLDSARYLATDAVYTARQSMPRVTGATASRLLPASGPGWFGIYFPDAHTWFMEQGTKPFTMRSLKGKTIPMWLTDTDGELRRSNPKAQVRSTEDGRTQVLVFRKATNPGAPGRIDSRRRRPGQPWSAGGGQIGKGNSGVRWRHPGIKAMTFLNSAITVAAFEAGLTVDRIYVVDGPSFSTLMDRRNR